MSLKWSPTSSRVRGSPRSRPNRNLRISLSRSSNGARRRLISSGSKEVAADSNGDCAPLSSTTSPNSASPSSLSGSLKESGYAAKRNASVTLSSSISTSAASSAKVAALPCCISSRDLAFVNRARVSPA